MTIANGATFWIRWNDLDATGSDDAMGIDDFVLTATTASANTITLGTVTGFPACVTSVAGAAVSAGYTSAGAGFTTGTTYTLELSDASGNFPGTSLGTLTSVAVGANTVSGTVPAGTAAGAAYKVRVTSASPTAQSSASSSVAVTLAPTNFVVSVAGTSPQTFPNNGAGSLLTASVGTFTPSGASTGVTYQWKYGTSPGGPYTTSISGATSATYTPQGADFGAGVAGNYYLVAQATSTVTCATVVKTSTEVPITTTAPAPQVTVKQGATTYPSSGTAYSFGSVVWGSSSSAISFTIQNTGTANLNLSGFTASGDFSATAPLSTSVAAAGSTTFTVIFTPTGTGTRTGSITIPSNDPATPYVLNLTGTGLASNLSDVIFNSGFTYNSTGIDYAAKQGATITSTNNTLSEGVYSVTVRDGGGATDADNLPTILDNITFSTVQGISSIRSAALFNGNALVSNAPVINTGAGTIAFTGLVAALGANVSRVTAADGSSFNLVLRVTFNTTVTDATQLRFTLTNANTVAAASGSSTFTGFSSLTSSTATNDNRIDVIATTLQYSQAPPTTAGVNVDLTVALEAVDANGKRDTDFRNLTVPTVTLARGAGTGAFSAASGLTKSLTSGLVTWTDLRYNTVENGVTLVVSNSGTLGNPAPFVINFVAFAGILWDGGAGTTNWFDANNWSTNAVPTAADDVRLNNSAVSGSYTVTIGSAGAVARSLQVGVADAPNIITLSITAVSTLDVLTVGGGALPALDVEQGGVVINSVSGGGVQGVNFSSSADTWVMNGTGTFIQNTSSAFPTIASGKATFAANTTFEVRSAAATNWANSGVAKIKRYGNLTVTNATTITLATGLNATDSLIVQGNMAHSGGKIRLNNATDNIKLRVKGNLTVGTGGILGASEGTGGLGTIIVEGNVTTTGTGSVAGTLASNSIGKVYVGGSFNGLYNASTSTDELIFTAVAGNTAPSTATFLVGSSVRKLLIYKHVILGANTGVSGTSGATTVFSGGILDFNGFFISGSSAFNLNAGGTLKITDPSGILDATTSLGNVRTSLVDSYAGVATYWYTGTATQATGTALPGPGSTAKTLIIDNPTTVTLTNPTGISSGGSLDIRQGTFIETSTAEITGSGPLTMTGGAYRLVKGVVSGTPPTLPQLTGAYTLSGGTIELAGPDNQSLRGGITYHSLTFANAGTKTLTTSVSGVTGTVTVQDAAFLDLSQTSTGVVTSVGLDGTGGLTMSGTARYKTTATGVRPGMAGVYNLTGGTIEFANSSVTAQTIRSNDVADPNRTYYNINVTGSNVGASSGNFAIAAGATFTVKTGGLFSMTDQAITGDGNITTEAGSTLYFGSPYGLTANGTGTTAGNIRLAGTRSFSSGASYGLIGALPGGFPTAATGNGLPTTVAGLLINKTSSSTVTVLTNPVTVTGTLALTSGILEIDNNDVTVDAAGTLTGGSTSSYVRTSASPTATGELIRTVPNTNTGVVYPIGTSTFTPATLTQAPAATTSAFAVRVFDGVFVEGTAGAQASTDAVNRTWMVDNVGGNPANATLTVQWNGVDELPAFNRNLARIKHYLGGTYDAAQALTAASGSDPYTLSRSGLTSFSPFAVGDGDAVLPVELTTFTARWATKGVQLNWATASERANDHFEVQRSATPNSDDFRTIGTVAGNGTSQVVHRYDYLDLNPLATPVAYYRLRQVDLDGTAHLSGVVAVRRTDRLADLVIYPNPVADQLTLVLPGNVEVGAVVEIVDALGRVVLKQTLTTADADQGTLPLDVSKLALGAYRLRMTGQTTPVTVRSFVKTSR